MDLVKVIGPPSGPDVIAVYANLRSGTTGYCVIL